MKPKKTTIEDVVAYYRELHEQLMGEEKDNFSDEEKEEQQKKYNERVAFVMKSELKFQQKALK